jgi:hypothetical protein
MAKIARDTEKRKAFSFGLNLGSKEGRSFLLSSMHS